MRATVTENKWFNYLKNLPLWMPQSSKTIILSPHPDDETLGAGGLIVDLRKANTEVIIIAITDGENAYKNKEKLGKIRQLEQEKALEKLGVSKENIVRLQLTDSSVHKAEDDLERLLLPFMEKNINLIAPWVGDFHVDHEATGRVAARIANTMNINLIYYFFWTWHTANISALNHLPLGLYPLSNETLELKKLAINCYDSQQKWCRERSILNKKLLKPAKRPFEVYLNYNNGSLSKEK